MRANESSRLQARPNRGRPNPKKPAAQTEAENRLQRDEKPKEVSRDESNASTGVDTTYARELQSRLAKIKCLLEQQQHASHINVSMEFAKLKTKRIEESQRLAELLQFQQLQNVQLKLIPLRLEQAILRLPKQYQQLLLSCNAMREAVRLFEDEHLEEEHATAF
jgi:hypothetical protein